MISDTEVVLSLLDLEDEIGWLDISGYTLLYWEPTQRTPTDISIVRSRLPGPAYLSHGADDPSQ